MTLLGSILVILFLSAVVYVVQQRNAATAREALLAKFPLLIASGTDLLKVSRRGYNEFIKQGKPYRLRTTPAGENDRIILPFKYIDEVKSSDETTGLSFLHFSERAMLLQYSKGPCQTPACTYALKQFLNRSLINMTPSIHTGIMTDIADALPRTDHWSPIAFYPKMVSLIARSAARVLADPQLCDNDEWIQLTVDITMKTFRAATSIRQKLNPAWYWLAPFLDQPTKDILRCRRRAAQIIGPIYAARRRERRSRGEKSLHRSTGLTWLLSGRGLEREPSVQQIADDLLFLSIAGIHTTAASLMIAIHDLISHPDALEDIRTEINQAYPKDAITWKASDLAGLSKLDSFMKESQRVHPMGIFTISRAPYNDFKFQDGLELPADVVVSMACQELNMDPCVFQNPEEFDAQRFLNLRESTGLSKYMFTAVAEDISINFGTGQHACPGRALAGTTMKIILAELLTKYDLAFEKGDNPPKMLISGLTRSLEFGAVFMVRKAHRT